MKPKFAIVTAHSGRPIMPQWYMSMQQLVAPPNSAHVYVQTLGNKMDDAYNALAEQSVASGAEFTMFVDDDTQLPPNTLVDLMTVLESGDPQVAMAGGIYTSRGHPVSPHVFKAYGQGPYWKWKCGEVFPCFAVGSGAMMVRNEVFEKLEKPWFKKLDSVAEIEQYGDLFPHEGMKVGLVSVDIFFCQKLAKAGYKVMAHGGVLPIHWDITVDGGKPYYLPVDSYPMRILKSHKIQGWMTGKELDWLAKQAEQHKQIVEVGSHKGRSTRALGDYALGTVWAFDDWIGPRDFELSKNGEFFHEFQSNLSDLLESEKVKVIKGDHGDESIIPDIKPDMVFIDGHHSYEAVKRDIEIWKKRMVPGGLLCGHDIITGSPGGVLQAVKEEFPGTYRIPHETDIWMVTV
jgi:Methyltransferase domain